MITKNCLLLLCLFLGFSLSAQKSTKVKGFVKDGKLKEVKLYMVEDGVHKPCATTPVAEDGAYGFVFTPARAGFYTVGSDRMDFAIYVQGGEEININILENKAVLAGKNTKENVALYGWENFADSIRVKSLCFAEYPCTHVEFFPEFTACVSKIDSVKNSIDSGNKAFDALLKKKIGYDVDFYATHFLQTPKTLHAERKDWPTYYKTIFSKDKFTTDEVLQLPRGGKMMWSYALFAYTLSGQAYVDPKGFMDFCVSLFKNDRLRGEFILANELSRLKSYDLYKKIMECYGKYFVTPSLKTRARVIGEQLALSASKVVAHDFTYPDVNGKNVSLSDFKGKVGAAA